MARNNKLLLMKKSGTSSPAPSAGNLEYGELAINYHADVSTIYFKDSANSVKTIVDSDTEVYFTTSLISIQRLDILS